MASRTKLTDTATLELYRVALENAETQPEISAIMADLGYDSTVIADGKALLTKTRTAYDANKTEDDETSAAYADFTSKKEQLEDTFNTHRKKAKVVFFFDCVRIQTCQRISNYIIKSIKDKETSHVKQIVDGISETWNTPRHRRTQKRLV